MLHPTTLQFLKTLKKNNNKPWFDDHRKEYENAKADFNQLVTGIATYGPEWLQQRSGLFDQSSLLNSPLLLWTMLSLSIQSNLPRLSKVNNPLAPFDVNLARHFKSVLFFSSL